ncbi:MAG: AtpZ/AtpI family protein [Acholeplasmataceae bacterium]
MNKKDMKQLYVVLNIVTTFFIETLVGMAIGYFAGKYLDLWLFKDKSIFVYILMILGVFGALWSLVRRALKLSGGDVVGKEDERH